MKRTLLDMTQGILNTLDADPVTSIKDTYEAAQVASRVRDTYFNLIDEQGLKANYNLTSLVALSSIENPHCMKLQDNVSRIIWFKYNISATSKPEYKDITYKTPEDFVSLCNSRDPLNVTDNFTWVLPNDPNTKLTIIKNKAPEFWTTFDDELIVFDAYNNAVESSMQSSKTQAYCEQRPTFLLEDSFVPDLPENMFSLLYDTAVNMCFTLDKERINPKLEQQENRHRVRSQRLKHRQQRDQSLWDRFPDYGRRR